MKKRSIIPLIVTIIILGFALFLYLNLNQDNRSGSLSSDGISTYRTTNMKINNLDFRFMMAKKPEFVNISYDIHSITQNTTGLVTIDIPYAGILTVPDNWSANKSTTSDSTLIYRLFSCNNTNPCTNDFTGQMVFTFSKGIDEKDRYHHSLKLSVKPSPFDEGISTTIQYLENGMKLNLLNDTPYAIEIFVDNHSDNINSLLPIPDRQYSSSIFGINTNVFSWNIKDNTDGLITMDYENPDERTTWTIVEFVLIPVGVAVGIAIIIDIIKSKDGFGSGNNSRQERKEHSQFINDKVYKRLLDVFIRPETGRRLVLKVPSNYEQYQLDKIKTLVITNDPSLILVSSLQYFEYAIEHLKNKKYKKILSHWTKANRLVNEYNNLIDSLSITIKTTIKKEMLSTFPNFIEFKADGRDNSYFLNNVSERLLNFHEYESKIEQIDLQKGVISGDNVYRIISDGITLMQSPNSQELNIDKCRQVLVSVYNDPDIQSQFKKLDKLRKDIGYEIGQFSTELEDLVIKINGGHMIKGKCNLEN